MSRRSVRIVGIEHEIAARQQWDDEHGWRIPRVAAIDDELRHHWAAVVLDAARDDDPLAFGASRLREAHGTFATDHEKLAKSLPPEGTAELRRVEAELRRRQEHLRQAERNPVPTGHRRLTRGARAGARDAGIVAAQEAVEAAVELVRQERASVRADVQARRAADPLRRELASALDTLSTALRTVEPPAPARSTTPRRSVEQDLGVDLGL